MSWTNFSRNGVTYDLAHLDTVKFKYTRPASEHTDAKQICILMSFSEHCFTDHHGEDESWIYSNAKSSGERYFCQKRYGLSKHLPDLIRELLDQNAYVLLTFMRHREQFFYLEDEYRGETYRVFLEVSAPKANYSDIRIDVKSAYDEKPWDKPVSGSVRYRLWRVIDARLEGIPLVRKRRR